MTNALKKHLEECEQKETRISILKGVISTDAQALIQLKGDYEEAVASDFENIDSLFHEMESLEKKIRAERHKLKTLESVTEKFLRKSAFDVLLEFPTIKPSFEKETKEINVQYAAELVRHSKAMQELKEQVGEVNDRYEEKAYEFLELTETHGITGKWEGKNSYPAGVRKDLEKVDEEAREKAREEYKLMPPHLYSSIQRAAEGRHQTFSLKGVK